MREDQRNHIYLTIKVKYKNLFYVTVSNELHLSILTRAQDANPQILELASFMKLYCFLNAAIYTSRLIFNEPWIRYKLRFLQEVTHFACKLQLCEK